MNECIITRTNTFYPNGCPVYNVDLPFEPECSIDLEDIESSGFFFRPGSNFNFLKLNYNNNIEFTHQNNWYKISNNELYIDHKNVHPINYTIIVINGPSSSIAATVCDVISLNILIIFSSCIFFLTVILLLYIINYRYKKSSKRFQYYTITYKKEDDGR